MILDDIGSGSVQDDKPDHRPNVNSLDIFETHSKTGGNRPSEVIPVGLINKAPETDDPIYYRVAQGSDGKTMTVGPFNITAQQIRDWKDTKTSSDIDDLVQTHQLRTATALTIKSSQLDTVLDLLSSGQKPSESMIQRFIPGDLQRVIESKRIENR